MIDKHKRLFFDEHCSTSLTDALQYVNHENGDHERDRPQRGGAAGRDNNKKAVTQIERERRGNTQQEKTYTFKFKEKEHRDKEQRR